MTAHAKPLCITDRRARAALLGIEPPIHLDALTRDIAIMSSADGRELCRLTALTPDPLPKPGLPSAPQGPSAMPPQSPSAARTGLRDKPG